MPMSPKEGKKSSTKSDIKGLRTELKAVEARLDSKIELSQDCAFMSDHLSFPRLFAAFHCPRREPHDGTTEVTPCIATCVLGTLLWEKETQQMRLGYRTTKRS